MKQSLAFLVAIVAVIALVAALQPRPAPPEVGTPSPTPVAAVPPEPAILVAQPLRPLPDCKAPKLTEVIPVHMKTSLGSLELEVYPQAAPNAARRFLELTRTGFYDKTPLFRVVPGFVIQFGVNSRKPAWKDRNFPDDVSYFSLDPGTLAFAKSGKDQNSTQVFFNLSQNDQLVQNGNFTVFARVTRGIELLPRFKQVGDPSMGLDQGELWRDTDGTVNASMEKPDSILSVSL